MVLVVPGSLANVQGILGFAVRDSRRDDASWAQGRAIRVDCLGACGLLYFNGPRAWVASYKAL